MGREIRHPVHPSHPLIQIDRRDDPFSKDAVCAVCNLPPPGLGLLIYICRGCELFIHLGCSGSGLVTVEDQQMMNHPSHPQHELRFLNRSCRFECDACGTTETGSSYICSICQYWIHVNCANLPSLADFHHHPHHSLSLAFILPIEYIIHNYSCGICNRSLKFKHWVYHCQLCRYVVHVKCASNKSHAATYNLIKNENIADEEHIHILKGPINDIYEELIRPFVKRERGEIFNPVKDDEINNPYNFQNHHHPLNFTLFSSLPSSRDNKNEEDEDDDDDDDERSQLTCDGCTMPIYQKQQNTSTSCSSSDGYESGYMSCDKCKYFLHLACFNLPQHLPAHPLHQINDHHLNLQSPVKLRYSWEICNMCRNYMNGLFYECTKCMVKIDIKCISLPETIKHAGHPHFDLKLVITNNPIQSYCNVCQLYQYGVFYRCEKCKVRVCSVCVLLPSSNKHRLEKHVLPLTFDASVDHPDEFYCADCEEKMNPKSWMYHCRQCDQSFHPECIPATSGQYRNINFGGQQYQVSHHSQHPLRFQIISKKKRCNVCHGVVYNYPGYQCTSCNFVMCHSRHEGDVKPID